MLWNYTEKMNFGKKVAASRAILGWNQPNLAEAAGVDANTVMNIEKGSSASARTINKITRALNSAGIVLTEDGVTMPDTSSIRFEGPTWFLDFLEDAYQTLSKEKNKELLILHGDNRVSPPEVYNAFKRLRQAGVRIREMVEDGNTFLHGPESDYRWIPAEHFKNYNTIIYADKVLIDFQTHGEVYKNKHRADAERGTFNLIWSLLPELKIKSTADVRY